MAWLKGETVGDTVRITRPVEFTKSVIARGLVSSPWAQPWFVDGTSGNDSKYSGKSPTGSFATIQQAVTKAGRGDVIYVRPLEYETDASDIKRYTEAVEVPYATNDLSLVGVSNTVPGNPNYGAKLQLTTGSSYALIVNAPAFHLENMCVRSEGSTGGGIHFYGVGAVDTPDYGEHAGSCGPTMYNCVTRGGYYSVRITGGYAAYIANCRFEGGSGQLNAIVLNGNEDPQRRICIRDSYFTGFNGAALANAYIRVYSNTDLIIQKCAFDIVPTDGYYIHATGTNLGMIAGCWFNIADLAPATHFVLGGLLDIGNYDSTNGLVA